MISVDLSDREPLVSDLRLEPIAEKLRSEFGYRLLEHTDFVTFIEPAREVTDPQGRRGWIPEMAVFAAVSPNPRYPTLRLMTHGTVSLTDWTESNAEFLHYAGKPDPLREIFRAVTTDHLRTLKNLREMN